MTIKTVDLISQKLFEKTKDQTDPTDYLQKNFKDLMDEVRNELNFKKLSKSGFVSKYKEAQHKACGMIHSQTQKAKK